MTEEARVTEEQVARLRALADWIEHATQVSDQMAGDGDALTALLSEREERARVQRDTDRLVREMGAEIADLRAEREELLERVARAEEALACADNLAEAVDAASRVDATCADHHAMYVCRAAYARARKEATP